MCVLHGNLCLRHDLIPQGTERVRETAEQRGKMIEQTLDKYLLNGGTTKAQMLWSHMHTHSQLFPTGGVAKGSPDVQLSQDE